MTSKKESFILKISLYSVVYTLLGIVLEICNTNILSSFNQDLIQFILHAINSTLYLTFIFASFRRQNIQTLSRNLLLGFIYGISYSGLILLLSVLKTLLTAPVSRMPIYILDAISIMIVCVYIFILYVLSAAPGFMFNDNSVWNSAKLSCKNVFNLQYLKWFLSISWPTIILAVGLVFLYKFFCFFWIIDVQIESFLRQYSMFSQGILLCILSISTLYPRMLYNLIYQNPIVKK